MSSDPPNFGTCTTVLGSVKSPGSEDCGDSVMSSSDFSDSIDGNDPAALALGLIVCGWSVALLVCSLELGYCLFGIIVSVTSKGPPSKLSNKEGFFIWTRLNCSFIVGFCSSAVSLCTNYLNINPWKGSLLWGSNTAISLLSTDGTLLGYSEPPSKVPSRWCLSVSCQFRILFF